MWEPSTWEEIEAALGNVAEGQHIDFKNGAALDNAPELAKDVAAMSVAGGVIAYGIDETNEVATSAPGVQITGQINRLHQILDSRVTPPISVEVRMIENPQTPGRGVLLVIVPPSVNAPHYWNEQFPARSGTTRRNLTEREIADLYLRRSAIEAEQAESAPILEGYVGPEWFYQPGLDMTDVGVMSVTVSPIGLSRLEYRLSTQLSEAARSAAAHVATILGPEPAIPAIFATWRPYEARGLKSGREAVREGYHLRSATYAATFLYASGFSFHMTVPLEYQGKKYAYEHLWAVDLIGMLALAGTFYSENSTTALVRVDASLSGLDGARPGPGERWFGGEPLRIPDYSERAVLAVREITTAPQDGAAALIDRFFASILPDGPDMHGRLAIG